jgi:hypothetical protein
MRVCQVNMSSGVWGFGTTVVDEPPGNKRVPSSSERRRPAPTPSFQYGRRAAVWLDAALPFATMRRAHIPARTHR